MQDAIRTIIRYIGDDPNREDLIDTPDRVIRAWAEMFSGYHETEPLKWFKSKAREMVMVRNAYFASTCEHHMLPFVGVADVAYIPNGWVIGVSKIPRLVDHLSRRLTIQENLTDDICRALTCDKTLGAAVSLRSRHSCMGCRGIRQAQVWMVTNAVSGKFEEDPTTRMEFLGGVGKKI